MITICDVGPRDGLQNEKDVVPPATRAELINRLAATGLRRIEAVSFVRDDAVPQMAGAEEVVAGIERRDGVEYAGLVLNEKGFQRFQSSVLDRMNVTLAATETFNQRNANSSLEEAKVRAATMVRARPKKTTVTLSVAFGCPFEGRVDPAVVTGLVEHFRELGAEEVVLADTIGVATPRQVKSLVEETKPTASTGTTLATPASRTRTPRSRPAPPRSTRRSAASADVRSPRARQGTSPPRTSSTCSRATASRRASTWTR